MINAVVFVLSIYITFINSIYAQIQDSTLFSSFDRANNASLYYGTYKPNLYFAVRNRSPAALQVGILWNGLEEYKQFNELRYVCDQAHDVRYSYSSNSRLGASQNIDDRANALSIDVDFAKSGKSRDKWGFTVNGRGGKSSLYVYIYSEDGGLSLHNNEGIRGHSLSIGEYSLSIDRKKGSAPGSDQKDLSKPFVLVQSLPTNELWRAPQALIVQSIHKSLQQDYNSKFQSYPPEETLLINPRNENIQDNGNIAIFQYVFDEGEYEVDVLFNGDDDDDDDKNNEEEYTLSQDITRAKEYFTHRFEETFPLVKPFTSQDYKTFGQTIVADLLGGVGYFYGTDIVDRSKSFYVIGDDDEDEEDISPQIKEEGPHELFTATPSRPFFPRGFYWDEGFHLLPLGRFDNALSLEILQSWFSRTDEDGWIAREQILGEEARSKVPMEFVTQYAHHANPPTPFIAVEAFLSRLEEAGHASINLDAEDEHATFATEIPRDKISDFHYQNPVLARRALSFLYPLLQRQFKWFRETQAGEIKLWDREAYSMKEGYRWKGRTLTHCFTSGLDDYPRARPAHDAELHVDLLSWIGLMSRAMKNVATKVGKVDDAATYQKIEEAIVHNIDDLHWSEKDNTYCDLTVDEYDENVHVCHKGYISIFPVITGFVEPNNPHLDAILDLIYSKDDLWTPYGLRSLSKADFYYGKDENYWRGPIWININYMALSSLYKNYVHIEGPYKAKATKIYNELRTNLVNNVYKEWKRTGFVWENYDPETGEGQRSHPFTGWDTMLVQVMSEQY